MESASHFRAISKFGERGIATTPATLDLFDIDFDAPLLDEKRKAVYVSLVASLLYPATHGRWDFQLPFSVLSKKVSAPTELDLYRARRALRYVNATAQRSLKLRADELQVHYHADASHIVHYDTGRGHYGAAISLGKHAPYCWATASTVKMVTRSTAETEFVAFVEKLPVALHLARMLRFMNLVETKTVQGWEDNEAAISLLHSESPLSARTRHIDVRRFWSAQVIKDGDLRIDHFRSEEFVVDGFTKPKAGLDFQVFVDGALGPK